MVRPQDVHVGPHPVLFLPGGKHIHVYQDVPLGLRPPVLLQCRAPPQPARMTGVLPEVVVVLAAHTGIRDAALVVEYLTDLRAQAGEPVPGCQTGRRLRISFGHPPRHGVRVEVFQPEELIVVYHIAHGHHYRRHCRGLVRPWVRRSRQA